MTTLKIEFPNQERLNDFTSWLCNDGEQDYWQWQTYRQEEDAENLGPLVFVFHHPQDERYPQNNEKRYESAEFCKDNIILTHLVEKK
jgi:hypothetical protein